MSNFEVRVSAECKNLQLFKMAYILVKSNELAILEICQEIRWIIEIKANKNGILSQIMRILTGITTMRLFAL